MTYYTLKESEDKDIQKKRCLIEAEKNYKELYLENENDDLIKRFISWTQIVMDEKKIKKVNIIAHNGNKYDNLFVLKQLDPDYWKFVNEFGSKQSVTFY